MHSAPEAIPWSQPNQSTRGPSELLTARRALLGRSEHRKTGVHVRWVLSRCNLKYAGSAGPSKGELDTLQATLLSGESNHVEPERQCDQRVRGRGRSNAHDSDSVGAADNAPKPGHQTDRQVSRPSRQPDRAPIHRAGRQDNQTTRAPVLAAAERQKADQDAKSVEYTRPDCSLTAIKPALTLLTEQSHP